MDTKRFFLYFIVITALALAGCGGGGGTQTAMPDPTPPDPMVTCPDGSSAPTMDDCPPVGPTPEEMALQAAKDAAMTAYMAAMAAVGGAVDPVAMQNAQNYAAMAKEANDSAQAAMTSAMAEEYQMAAETARMKAMEAAGAPGLGLTMLSNKLLNGDDIENAQLDGPPSAVPDPVNNAKNVDAAIDAATAPVNATPTEGFTNQGGLSDSTATQITISADGTNAVAVHKASGTEFEVQIGTTDLQQGEVPSRFYTKRGWEAQDLLLVDGTEPTLKTHLVISTDIKATTKEDDYTQTDATDPDVIVNSIITGDVPNDGSDFVASYNSNPEDNDAPVTGEFYCPAAETCSISVDEDDKVVAVTNYQFTSAATTTTKMDTDYMAWGMWVQASTRDSLRNTDGSAIDVPNAQVGAFAYGSMPFTVPTLLTGKATYNGNATGLYSAGGMVQYFDADAMLEADFGGATFEGGRISGSISNIVAAGQAVDGSLNLMRTDINTDGTFGIGTDAGDMGETDGVLGGNGFRGRWAGQLFGPAARTGASNAVISTTFPTTAAGTFNASTQDNMMSLIGAFGTWKPE